MRGGTRFMPASSCRITELLDYTPDEFQGRSLYSLCHGQDVDKIKKTHNDRE